ncbi:alpha/beta fold hydrolase [Mycolicibacterium sp. XJ1819]
MKLSERVWRIGSDFAGVLPRAHAAVSGGDDWNPLSLRSVRQLGEVVLDEMALSGMTLSAPPPRLTRSPEVCAGAAAALAGAGPAAVHREPDPLLVSRIRRRRIGRLTYERLWFDHDPQLPDVLAAEGFGGPSPVAVHLCRSGDDRRPWLVWVHGAGQGQPIDLLFARARRLRDELGFNVALPVQPGHGPRRKAWPAYPDMDPLGNVAGMIRVVSEVRALVRWLAPQSSALAVAGVSMGSPVAALVAHLEKVDGVAVYTPIFGLNAMIAQHLGRWGPSVRDTTALLTSEEVTAVAAVVDHLAVEPTPPRAHRLIVGAWHDRMAMREPALELHQRWGGQLYWHPGSHVGHLFAAGVQDASRRFLRGVAAGTER